MVINSKKDPFSEIVIGYKKKANNQFVRQKTLTETGIWDSRNKKLVDD